MIQYNANFLQLNISEVCNLLEAYIKSDKKLLLLCHVNPDGDTVGSAFALRKIYTLMGGTAYCACTSDVPEYLRFLLDGQTSIEYIDNMEKDYDYIWSIDVASPTQLGRLSNLADQVYLSIDHHGKCTLFSSYCLQPDASATGELIFAIYKNLIQRKQITENAAVCRAIYAAISADTGSFQYSNTTPETFRIGAALVETINHANDGAGDPASIAHRLHGCRTIQELHAQKLVIERLHLAFDNTLAYVCIPASLPAQNGLSDFDFGGMVDIPRSVSGVLIGLSLKESRLDPGTYKISARSNCDIDVAKILSTFGGGGHKRAAGATITASTCEDATAKVVAAFADPIKLYMKENNI